MKKHLKKIWNLKYLLIHFSVERPKTVVSVMLSTTLVILALAAAPTIFPERFPAFPKLTVDTDPENMLPHDEPARLFHDEMKKELDLHEMVAFGVVNKKHPQGVYNKKSLNNIYKIVQVAKTLEGVKSVDIMAPSMVDNIEQGSAGEVKFSWLLPRPPTNEAEALAVQEKVKRLPFLKGTMFSEDQKAIAVFIPITEKKYSYQIYTRLRKEIKEFEGDDEFHIAGLPVAEDTFGVEMFKQMAISAPLAMLIIFILMLVFFKKVTMVISPMIVAMVAVISTMGLLVISGFTVHIMSSMIPIFIMPIAVLDAVHILSDFFDTYQETRDRKKTILHVMDTLFAPMLYTSLTTIAGFASLALTPNPPVQVFGSFVALGVLFAWFWTIFFVPSYIMLLSEKSLENFGMKKEAASNKSSLVEKFLAWTGNFTVHHAKGVLAGVLVIGVISVYGIQQIVINDNPTRWFAKNHPIRVADKEMNKHLAGTYMGYLSLQPKKNESVSDEYINNLVTRTENIFDGDLDGHAVQLMSSLKTQLVTTGKNAQSKTEFLTKMGAYIEEKIDEAQTPEQEEFWEEIISAFDEYKTELHLFKRPEVLRYMEKLQLDIEKLASVGKTSSIVDIVKTVHRELFSGNEEYYTIPNKVNTVGQSLITYQSSHRPQDLWHFVTPDYEKSNIWVQLKSGNNQDMQAVVDRVEKYVQQNPPPLGLEAKWFGLTYINLVWQQKMVTGMLEAFLGSFAIVLIMMIVLFKSPGWGILSMIPLSVTILFIYGAVGLVGKDYDMPVAVLSSLSLGLAVDYAIHFLARSREITNSTANWQEAIGEIFSEPARAIFRNVIVVGVGFTPLLLSPLVPYQTVGLLIAGILLSAGFVTLFILPALMTVFHKSLFKVKEV